jgi:hypothetical protein
MKEALTIKMEEAVGNVLKDFFAKVETEYKLPKDALWGRWTGCDENKPITTLGIVIPKKDNANKKSDYQTFFSIQRNKMVKENPTITFGEISKQVSAIWKTLSPTEKIKFSSNATNNTLPHTPEDFRAEYIKMSTTDLKNLCKENGVVVKFRKKDDIVNALVDWQEKKQLPGLLLKKDELLTKGRSKLELSAEDKDDDEEDFYFHDDGTSSSGESRVCDEEDTSVLISDDEDIFGDDE